MKSEISALHARAFCHATEDFERVRAAMANAFGECELQTHRTEGHHGNPIVILECTIQDAGGILGFFSKLSDEDIRELLRTVEDRVDDDSHLFLKIDKQSAFKGDFKLSSGEDVLSIRAKVRSFPARRELAIEAAREFFTTMLGRRHEGR